MSKVLFIAISWTAISLSVSALNIRIATYNVHNYMNADRLVENSFRKDYPKPETEKSALRTVIAHIQPDVLALQEMGDEALLIELQQDLKAEGTEYPYRAWSTGNDTRHLAILSKIPFTNTLEEKNLPLKRGILGVTFKTNNTHWTLVTVHLKSRHTIDDKDPGSKKQRIAEAVSLKKWLKSTFNMEEELLLLGGDFNDRAKSKTLKLMTKQEFLHRLPSKDSRDECWTFRNDREGFYDQVDFILVTPKFLDHIPFETSLPKKAKIADLPASNLASDHRMVYVDVEF